MGRILGIDYGRKRTGVAVTDPLKIVAGNLATVPTHTLMQFIKDYIAREPVERIVIGKPTQLNGEPSESMRYITTFVNRLRKELPDSEYQDRRRKGCIIKSMHHVLQVCGLLSETGSNLAWQNAS